MESFRGVFALDTICKIGTREELAVLAFIDEQRLYVQRTIVIRHFNGWLKQENACLVNADPRALKQGDMLKMDVRENYGAFYVEVIVRDRQGNPEAVIVTQKFKVNDPRDWFKS